MLQILNIIFSVKHFNFFHAVYQVLETFSEKGQKVNISGFESHTVFVVTTQFCRYSAKVATGKYLIKWVWGAAVFWLNFKNLHWTGFNPWVIVY